MKETLLALQLLLTTSGANIVFPYVQPTCDYLAHPESCLRGQVCVENNTCVHTRAIEGRLPCDTSSRSDGRCGRDFDGACCDSNGPYGPCCSQYGWCGNAPDHCLGMNACQFGCMTGPFPPSHPPPAEPMKPGDPKSSATPLSEPVIGEPTTTAAISEPSASITTNGMCGAANGGTICGDWFRGSCCSMYGFCGNTSAHCGQGCQSGPCDQPAESPPPAPSPAPLNGTPGSVAVVGDSGVPAMHAALLPNGKVVFLDKIENFTKVHLADGRLAYSSEYDPTNNGRVGIAYKTNAFCSGGSFLANGTLVNVGGNARLTWLDPTVGDGFRAIRYVSRSSANDLLDGQDWQEPGNQLDTARWYASVQTMPDGTLFVASGSLNGLDPTIDSNNNPTYEILDREGISQGRSVGMELLEKAQPYFMYPFIHLLRDGTLFVFASKFGEVFDVARNTTVKQFEELQGYHRTYPNTGGSVLLPLSSADDWNPDIIICGGGDYQDITSPTDPSCGRIKPLDEAAEWEMDSMPEGRSMVEGTLLPDGTVLWVNGCNLGAQGFELARDPTLEALIYDPAKIPGERWTTGANLEIPRLYHSVALLLLDGTLIIAGSNPFAMPVEIADEANPYVTDFRVQIYTPPYLSGDNADKRPTNVHLSSTDLTANSETFNISFWCPQGAQDVKIALYHGGFVTHSLHMSHRMLFLDNTGWKPGGGQQYITVTMPPNGNVAPPGPYVVYVTVDGVPSVGQFVMVA